MKKRILSIMIVAALAVSMTACDAASDEATAESESAATASTTEKAEEEKEEEAVETAESVTETEAEVVEPVYIDDINADNNYDGVTFETTDGRICYYRYSDKKIFDLSEHVNAVYSAYCSGDIAVIDDNVVNMNTGDVLYTLSDFTKLIKGSVFGDTGSLMLSISPDGFADGESSIVVLKNDGSVINNAIPYDDYDFAISIDDHYVAAGFMGEYYLYDTTAGDKILDTPFYIERRPVATTGKYLYLKSADSDDIFSYNKDNGDIGYPFENIEHNNYGYGADYGVVYGFDWLECKYCDIIDTATDEMVHFDISSFVDKCDDRSVTMIYVCPDYMLIECSKNDNEYLAVLDRNGNTIVEPVEHPGYEPICSYDYVTCHDLVIDINAKTVTNLDEGLTIKAFDRNGSNTLVIEKDGYYFLADAAAPNDLCSPFDDYVE